MSEALARARSWGCWLWLAFALLSSQAIAASWGTTQYHQSSWTLRDGAPPEIWALAQDRSGILWLGTGVGLYRFDGIRFEQYKLPTGQGFASSNITALLSDSRGRLWIGLYLGGVSVLEAGKVRHFPPSPQVSTSLAMRMAEDRAGNIWLASFSGLYRFDGQTWQRVGPESGYDSDSASDVMVDSRGTLWVASGKTVVKLPAGASRFLPTGIVTGSYAALLETPDGAFWVSDGDYGTRSLAVPERAAQAPGFGHFASMRLDHNGALWGTDRRDGGVVRVAGLERFPRGYQLREQDVDAIIRKRNGLSSDRSIPVLADREGSIWVGTNMGLHRFHPNSVHMLLDERLAMDDIYGLGFSARLGLLVSSGQRLYRVDDRGLTLLADTGRMHIYAIHDAGGTVYLMEATRVHRYADGILQTLDMPTHGRLSAMAGDGASGFLVMQEGQGLWHYDGTRWTRLGAGVIPPSGATTLMRDPDGSVWIGYTGSRVVHWNNGLRGDYGPRDGLDISAVTALARIAGDVLAAGEAGAALLRGGRVRLLRAAETDHLNGITGIAATDGGEVWMNGIRGLIRVRDTAFANAWRQGGKLDVRLLDVADGVLGVAQQSVPISSAAADAQGRLWFATNQGLAMLDPRKQHYNPVAPTVSIKSVLAGTTEHAVTQGREFAAGTRDLQISYAASSLAYPERVHFRYRLEGFDEHWQDAGNRRVAYYTNLEPGIYHFRVQAANESEVWSEQDAKLAFSIAPRFTQTSWFVALCAIAAGGLVYAAYLLRLRRIAQRMHMRFKERHQERERIARELHDTLLQGMQGMLLSFQALASKLPRDAALRQEMERVLDRTQEAIREGRDRIHLLRDPEASTMDLAESLGRHAQELAAEHQLLCDITVPLPPRPLQPMVYEELRQIGREAITNACLHSKGARVDIRLTYSDSAVVLTVQDDGIGIPEERLGVDQHWGLRGMRERALLIGATLSIADRPDGGMEVKVSVNANEAYSKH